MEAAIAVEYPEIDRLVLRALTVAAAGDATALRAACEALTTATSAKASSSSGRPLCHHGAGCRIRTAAHTAAFSHAHPTAAARTQCAFGAKCYRTGAAHRAACAHPGDADWATGSDRGVQEALERSHSLSLLPPSSPDRLLADGDDASSPPDSTTTTTTSTATTTSTTSSKTKKETKAKTVQKSKADAALAAEVTVRGVVPLTLLRSGEHVLVASASSTAQHTVKRTGNHYYCTCFAWKNQKASVDARTCKHLKQVLGHKYEEARVGGGGSERSSAASGAIHASDASKASVKRVGKPDLLLANKFDGKKDPTGWFISEKLDGVRAFWDGNMIMSRNGLEFCAPDWFKKSLPSDMTLDGELWAGRGQFQLAVSIARTVDDKRWKQLVFMVFDCPSQRSDAFETRMDALKAKVESLKVDFVKFVDQTPCRDRAHMDAELARVEALGGEGLMLRQPKSEYVGARSSTLLKVKSFKDADAKIVGHAAGKGKYKTMTGALLCRLGADGAGVAFKVGSGMSDADRENPPSIGSVIIVRFQELTPDGVPRFPTYVGVRGD